MDLVKDENIVYMLEMISLHYRANISNRYTRPVLFQLPLDKATWKEIETFAEKFDQFKERGFYIDELYRQILAASEFIFIARRETAPTLRQKLGEKKATHFDKILRNITINNFSSNLKILADMLSDLYVSLVELDKVASKKKGPNSRQRKPVYLQIPELADLGKKLVDA